MKTLLLSASVILSLAFTFQANAEQCGPGYIQSTVVANGTTTLGCVADTLYQGNITACRESVDELKKEADKISKACDGSLSTCIERAETCRDCAGEDSEDCTQVTKLRDCPEYAASRLEEIEEKKKAAEETKKEREEEVADLKEQIMTKQNEIKELETEFQTFQKNRMKQRQRDIEDLQKKYEEIKDDKVKEFTEIGNQIQEALNALRDADIKYNDDVTKIYAECHQKAQTQLAAYRAKRNEKIAKGTLSTRNGLTDLVSQSGKTRKQMFVSYAKERAKECREDFVTVSALKNALTLKNTTKERINQLITRLEGMQNKVLQDLQNSPSKADQELARILQDAQDEITDKQTEINTKIAKLATEISSLQQKLQLAERYLKEIETEFTDYLEKYQVAKSAARSGSIDKEDYDGFMSATDSFESFLEAAHQSCQCGSGDRNFSTYCSRIRPYFSRAGVSVPSPVSTQPTADIVSGGGSAVVAPESTGSQNRGQGGGQN